MDKFLQMRTYVHVVDAGSFIGATVSLDMSKAAVSRHIGDLEARLGVRLLNRTTRRLSMTEDGEVFFLRCKTLLGELDAAEAEITSRTGEAVGLIKVSAPVSFGILHLADAWAAFSERHPNVTFEVTLSDRVSDLVEEGYDLAVRISKLENSSLIGRKLSSTRVVLCASPQYLARAGTPRHPHELGSHAVIAYSYWAARDEWAFDGPDGRVTVITHPKLRTNNGDTCRAAALHHQGIILQPTFIVGEDLAAGRLIEICPDYRSIDIGIYAVYGSRKHVAPKVRLLIDFLVERFSTPRWPQ